MVKFLSEKECYALLYGVNIFYVPHYFTKIDLDGKGSFRLFHTTANSCSECINIIIDTVYFTFEDVFKKLFARISNA